MIKLSVCIGTACHINGANNVVMSFQHLVEEYGLHDKIEFSAAFCANQCKNDGVCVHVNDKEYRILAQDARKFFKETILPLI